ncbi:regulatory protein RecX [Sphingoaurantiacus capsulatus]|uniref:Regulatory protein RecX n=1 Tax=Sphingoaurantiacus capsulatus TaxID=1771310 RepID=A0ABV7XCH0_9SPHN
MASSMEDRQSSSRRERKPKKPLTPDSLNWFALRYVERYATTREKLRRYLSDKLRERGWAGEGQAPIDAMVERFAELGYVDDRSFGESKARSLGRRGYGARRIDQTLTAAGIEPELREEIRGEVDDREAALAYARRKRIGPFAAEKPSPELRQKQFAAMVRAGHGFDQVKAILGAETEHELYDEFP